MKDKYGNPVEIGMEAVIDRPPARGLVIDHMTTEPDHGTGVIQVALTSHKPPVDEKGNPAPAFVTESFGLTGSRVFIYTRFCSVISKEIQTGPARSQLPDAAPQQQQQQVDPRDFING